MVSLWGTKGKGDQEEEDGQHDGEGSNNAYTRRSQEADERTRLFPPQRNDGYLDPDDPAVRALKFPRGIALICI